MRVVVAVALSTSARTSTPVTGIPKTLTLIVMCGFDVALLCLYRLVRCVVSHSQDSLEQSPGACHSGYSNP